VRAYAYLLHEPDALLNEDARKRLETIKEASELGAGFRIAMRDLEIRGGGDVLGTRQHGHISAVGFDLYCRLLARAVEDVKEAERQTTRESGRSRPSPSAVLPEATGPTIGLPLDALLPDDYVPEEDLRLGIYRRMAGVTTIEEIERMRRELQDRFGTLPEQAENLLYLLRLKVLATAAGVQVVTTEGSRPVIGLGSVGEVKRRREKDRLPSEARVVNDRLVLSTSLEHETWRLQLEETLRAMAN
jgi:transcription-repair coupling factor (superfamily II helicase)